MNRIKKFILMKYLYPSSEEITMKKGSCLFVGCYYKSTRCDLVIPCKAKPKYHYEHKKSPIENLLEELSL
jgi:hypothetical protein